MRKLVFGGWFLVLVAVPVILTTSRGVKASVSITSPSAGACYKGGSSVDIAWTSDDPSYGHAYVSYDNDGSPPTYPDTGTGFIAHPTTSSISWTVPSATAGGYQVYVESHSGGHAVLSTSLTGAFSIDSSGPSAPTLSISSKSTTTVSLSWTASSDTGCKGLAGYKVFRNNQQITTTSSTTYQDSGLSPSTAYQYKITAYDDFASANSSDVSATTDAETPPPTSNSDNSGSSGTTTKPKSTTNNTDDSPDPQPETPAETAPKETTEEETEESSETAPATSATEQPKAKTNKLSKVLALSALGAGILGAASFSVLRFYRNKKSASNIGNNSPLPPLDIS